MTPEEEKIWQGIQEKDLQVFENYYKGHYRFFLLASASYLKDSSVAQEIVDDIFMRLWEDAGRINVQTSLKSYIYRAVVNRSLDELEKNKRLRQLQQDLALQREDSAQWKEMEDNELRIRLYRAIDQLPERCRKVFTLSRFEGLRHQDIAHRLGISLKTVKNHISRALKDLYKVIGEWNALWLGIISINFFLALPLGLQVHFSVL
jgi:RNA polymerase sigma-70 factor (family 1)